MTMLRFSLIVACASLLLSTSSDAFYTAAGNALKGFMQPINPLADKMKGVLSGQMDQSAVTDQLQNMVNDKVTAIAGEGAASMIGQFGGYFKKYMQAIQVLQVISDLRAMYNDPHQVANETLHRVPIVGTTFAMMTAVCQIPGVIAVPYLGPGCEFINLYAVVIMGAIKHMKLRSNVHVGECITAQGLIQAMSGNENTKAKIILAEMACLIDSGYQAHEVVDPVVAQYGALLDKTNLIKRACKKSMKEVEFQRACKFAGQNEKMLQAAYDEYMKEADAWLHMLPQTAH